MNEKSTRQIEIAILMNAAMLMINNQVISPVLSDIAIAYPNVSSLGIQMILTLSSLVVIPSVFLVNKLSSRFSARNILTTGLLIIAIFGFLGAFQTSYTYILVCRVFVGIGNGFISPFTNALVSYYFTGEKVNKMVGLTSATRVFGGMVVLFLSGVIGMYNWKMSFFLYIFAFIAALIVHFNLPNDIISKKQNSNEEADNESPFTKKIFYLASMQLMSLLVGFTLLTNISLFAVSEGFGNPASVSHILVFYNLFAMSAGLLFARAISVFKQNIFWIIYPIYFTGYLIMTMATSITTALIAVVFLGIGQGLVNPVITREINANIKDKSKAIKVYSMLSVCVYLGQFISPIIITIVVSLCHFTSNAAPFYAGLIMAFIAFIQCLDYRYRISKQA